MANYLTTHYKGKWRIISDIDEETNDFPIDCDGERDEDCVYISCRNGNKIWYWGLNDSRRAVLGAYIPSLGRGRNIKKAMKKDKIEFFNYDESAEEVIFHFLASDIEYVANALGAKTSGASISPFSSRNLPSSNFELPQNLVEEYKSVISKVGQNGMLVIKDANNSFLAEIMEKELQKKLKDKKFSIRNDMKVNKMSRQVKEYIWKRGYWDRYIEYLKDKIG